MRLDGKIAVVTGAAGGIGSALAARFVAEGAQVVGVDRRPSNGVRECDVTDAAAVAELVQGVIDQHGRIDLFCSNAGITTGVALDDPDDLWHVGYEINVMAHVYAARAVIPHMLDNGGGYLLNTASAAGLLTSPGDAVYAVTKHGAVAFAQWLSITYGARGIRVSVLCPMGVATPMLMDPLAAGDPAAQAVAASGEIVTPEHVADTVIAGLAAETFLILPHPEVGRFWAQKAADPDRWLAGMRRLTEST
ncbi:MAG TPA: SDR family oxidoreductase [Jatrophihabitantaceae bacterium]|jgi:NAD(P)-dependent dehydrogenase (short-subunit alcohol dehydrogenase family)|nr:SDR family oxidoreductase [Jatrophihabitantaceae bacterium]